MDPALAQIPTLLLSQQVMMFIPDKKIAVDRRSAISDHHYGPAPYPGVHCNTKVLWSYPVVLEKKKPQEQKTTLNSSLMAAIPPSHHCNQQTSQAFDIMADTQFN